MNEMLSLNIRLSLSLSLSLSLKNKAWFYFYLSMKKAEYFGDIFSVENLLGLYWCIVFYWDYGIMCL